MLPGTAVKFGRQWLHCALANFVLLAESSVMVMFQENVDLLSTNPIMHIDVRLINVNP